MKTKHTPGPWTKYYHKDSIQICLPKPQAGTIAVIKISENDQDETNDANAHLIAAAPELLEALQFIVSEIYSRPDLYKYMDSVGAMKGITAIRKATGE